MDQAILQRRQATAAKLDVNVARMSCASCVRRVERAVAAVPGVLAVSVNLAIERATVTPALGFDIARLTEAVAAAGYQASPIAANPVTGAQPVLPRRRDGPMATLALVFAAPLVVPMVAMPAGFDLSLPGWLQLGLAALVQCLFGA